MNNSPNVKFVWWKENKTLKVCISGKAEYMMAGFVTELFQRLQSH